MTSGEENIIYDNILNIKEIFLCKNYGYSYGYININFIKPVDYYKSSINIYFVSGKEHEYDVEILKDLGFEIKIKNI